MMNRTSLATLLLAISAFLLISAAASAEPVTLTGKMNGLNCVLTGYICPVDKKDPVKALETDFVLQTPDGKYYYLPNLSRDIKATYFLDTVEISGNFDSKYSTIEVSALKVKQPDGDFKTVWSQAMLDEERQRRCKEAERRFTEAGDSIYGRPAAMEAVRQFCGRDY